MQGIEEEIPDVDPRQPGPDQQLKDALAELIPEADTRTRKFIQVSDGKHVVCVNLDLVCAATIDPMYGRETVTVQFIGGITSRIIGEPAKEIMRRFGVVSRAILH